MVKLEGQEDQCVLTGLVFRFPPFYRKQAQAFDDRNRRHACWDDPSPESVCCKSGPVA